MLDDSNLIGKPTTEDDGSAAMPLVIAEGIRYNCQGCGRCCGGWAVGLTEEDYEKIKNVDWGSLHPELADKELYVHREKEFAAGTSAYAHHTKARPDGSCPFLIENRCFIHSTLGEENKPRMCQLFPYTFVPTPAGIFVGVSWNSTGAVRNQGALLTEQRPMLENKWRQMVDQERALGKATAQVAEAAAAVKISDLASIKFDVNLVPGSALSFDEYMIIETRMIEMIRGDEYASIFAVLIGIGDLLFEAVRLKSNHLELASLREFKPTVDRWIKSEPGFFEQKVFNLLCFKNLVWPRIREQNAAKWGTFAVNPMSDPKVVSAAMKAVIFDKMPIDGGDAIKISTARKYKVEPFTAEMNEFFRRAIYLKIFSKAYCGTVLSGLSVIAGYNTITGGFISAIVYAKARALAAGRKDLSLEDLFEGFFVHDKEATELNQLDKDKAGFFDMGFSSPRLFTRLLAQMSRTVG